jgi:hypothetical protein
VYLGLTIDTALMTLTLPEEKVQKILKGCQSTLRKDMVSVRDLSRLIGMMSATTLAVLPAPQRAPGLEDTNTEENTVLPDYGVSERGIEGRAGVVDRNAQPVERPPNSPTDPGP